MAVAKSRRAERGSEPVRTDGSVDRRAQLLASAAELFAAQGYAKTTVRDIGDRTGILAGSIYHHFSSKEAMLDEILREFLSGLHERFSAIEEREADPRRALSELIRTSFAAIHDTPHAVAVYQNESGNLAHRERFGYVADYSSRIEQLWIRVLTAGQASGVFRRDIDVKLAYLLIRDAVWSTVRWYRPGGQFPSETVADQYLELLYGGLL
ncbi:AcrR family transcriptional regulator [Streptosporangium becharense]|uniref:AcrR family transcriptional regulator n=1 Tax=Streptosporangium becharense TaxID=1816182 RepID=A0A7W9MDY7_9ACTN|nr:TetR/AcrR family transcriptional regulator [Streptosporangium becharense]MBB2910697.1 AcrR family transcriptional regulator [Streptosporangium becharense]MBB5817392.1 AcrR family transcriptional regulator [Streptosporangium becharense]